MFPKTRNSTILIIIRNSMYHCFCTPSRHHRHANITLLCNILVYLQYIQPAVQGQSGQCNNCSLDDTNPFVLFYFLSYAVSWLYVVMLGCSPVFVLTSACFVDVPSAPSIDRVEPYSSTAQVEFDEPASSGGVPILKYKAEWRIAGQGWTDREYDIEDGE